ncbi:MAG: NAD(P)H-hydrate epimerase, partial [Ignavibacteria bacterium]
MKNVFFNNEVLYAERKIISSLKIPSVILMENAGKNFTEILLNRLSEIDTYVNNERNFIVLAGKGNNAGDGFVIARHLCNKNIKVTLVLLSGEKDLQGDAAVNYNIIRNSKTISENLRIFRFKNTSDIKRKINFENSIIIDAIFGVGFRGAPDKKMSDLFKFLNQIKCKTLFAADVPSGLSHYNQDTEFVKADVTISMGVRKFHTLFYKGRELSGEIEIADIGIPENEFTNYNKKKIQFTEEIDVSNFIPLRKKNSNKYTNGKVLVIAGSKGLTGAVYLSSVSAMKTGAGAVISAVPESVNDILEIKMTEVMTMPVSETIECTLSLNSYDKIKTKIKWADTILIGPGLSKNEETMELVRYVVK